MQTAEIIEQIKQIAIQAGQAVLRIAEQSKDVKIKADGSPVTKADMASQEIIKHGLESFSHTPIVSEEHKLPDSRTTLPKYWLVDPLDGTKEFINARDEYTVNIALVEAAEPVLGVIYAPAVDTLYYAARDNGAWKQLASKPPESISASGAGDNLRAVVSRSHLSPQTETLLKRLGITNVISHGSSIKMCAVAEGTAEIYPRLGPTCLWDTAAGTAIAREAGCAVKNLEGEDLNYDYKKGIKRPGFIVYSEKCTLDEAKLFS